MGAQSKITIQGFFYQHPIFRYEEFVAWKTKHGTSKRYSINNTIQYYLKTGKLIRLRKELYAVVPPNETLKTIQIDSYILAALAAKDSVLSYHTALELHGLAYSAFEQFTFLTTQKTKSFEFANQRFQPVSLPKALKTQNANFCVEIVNRQGVDIRVTNLARTFVDVLDRPDLCGGWEEVCRSINDIAVLKIDEVIAYCLKMNNARLAAKVGFFLEQRTGAFAVSSNQLQPLLNIRPKSPQYLSKHEQKNCCLVKKWNLMMPITILEKSWEEPNVTV